MRASLLLLTFAVTFAAPADAQGLSADAHFVLVTDRHPGGSLDTPARGIGTGGAVGAALGRFGIEAHGLFAQTSREGDDATQNLTQFEVRARFAIVPQVAVEASMTRRYLDPDPAGTEMGFVSAGVYASLPVGTWGRFWGRMAYIPYAGFSGTGTVVQGLSAEAGLGFEAALVGSRVYLVGSYGFQRVERRVENVLGVSSETPLELDAARLGFSLRLGRARTAAPQTQPE
jgi:hypothetical protein